jgi:hypothetical protein
MVQAITNSISRLTQLACEVKVPRKKFFNGRALRNLDDNSGGRFRGGSASFPNHRCFFIQQAVTARSICQIEIDVLLDRG